tara:strand:+ start:3452 stop:4078 length:627 start_codon:yes stop_codon:yes gene_type:complete
MNFDKYRNNGWGISIKGFKYLFEIISQHEKDSLSILEFGSGISTQFLVDVAETGIKKIRIDSYDNDVSYSFRDADKYDFLNLKITNLLECVDKDFSSMMLNKKYDESCMKLRTGPPTTRQKNCFYEIKQEDLSKDYDLVILDGPNGNGRSFSFLHLKDLLKEDCYVFVDDVQHYPFEKILRHFFNVTSLDDQYPSADKQFKIFKIKSR